MGSQKKSARQKPKPVSLFESANAFVSRHLLWITLASIGLYLLFSLIVFNTSFSVQGDDSAYVVRASELIRDFTFPGFQGPVYPMVLSIVVAFSGISAVPLKALSLLFLAGFIWFTYQAFRDRIPALLLASILLIISLNYYFHYFASQTNSETLFLLIYAIIFRIFFRYFIDDREPGGFRTRFLRCLLLAFCCLMLGLTRPVGFAAAAVILFFFAVRGQWKNLTGFFLGFLFLFLCFQGLKYLVWGSSDLHFTGQASALLSRNYYDPGSGREDLAGFADRLLQNSKTYLSVYFYSILGILPITPKLEGSWWLTAVTWLLLLGGIVFTWKKNKYLLFTGISTAVFLAGSFIILQAYWGQPRLVFPYVPHLLLVILSLFYFLFEIRALRPFQFIFLLTAVALVLVSFTTAVKATRIHKEHRGIAQVITPDWDHYIKVSQWSAKNLPPEAVIACRKPSISFINSNGRDFYGISQIPVSNSHDFFTSWKNDSISYRSFLASDIAEKKLPPILVSAVRDGFVALVYTGVSTYYVITVPDSLKPLLNVSLQMLKIRDRQNIDSIHSIFQSNAGKAYVAHPDTLVRRLADNGITHLIMAQLRADPNLKSGRTINTMEMYMSIVAMKYPQILEQMVQIGDNNDEPAGVFRIRYDRYGIPFRASAK